MSEQDQMSQAAPVMSLSGLPRPANDVPNRRDQTASQASEQAEEQNQQKKRNNKRDALFNINTQLPSDTAALDSRASTTEMARMDNAVKQMDKQNKENENDDQTSMENIVGLASLAAGVAMHGLADGVSHHVAEEALKDESNQKRAPSPEPEA